MATRLLCALMLVSTGALALDGHHALEEALATEIGASIWITSCETCGTSSSGPWN